CPEGLRHRHLNRAVLDAVRRGGDRRADVAAAPLRRQAHRSRLRDRAVTVRGRHPGAAPLRAATPVACRGLAAWAAGAARIVVTGVACYAFPWLEYPGRAWLFVLVIALLVVPLQMALIPVFHLYNTYHLYDTIFGLILFHTAFGLPFAIFLLRNFFIGIPRDILESARIDGASEMRIFLRLILPLGLPAIASLAIFQFLWTWNDLIVSLTFGTTPITVWIYGHFREFSQSIDV